MKGQGEKALLTSRGALPAEDFCAATGLGFADLITLAELGAVDALRREDGSIRLLFDDALPSRQQLHELGYAVRSDYRPERLASFEDEDRPAWAEPAAMMAEARRTHELKYAVVERERRWLIAELPADILESREILDRYLEGTRLRLRQVTYGDGRVERKLGHKVRLGDGPDAVAHTSIYLDDDEWSRLMALPGRELRKTRHVTVRGTVLVVVDEHVDGSLVAEIDDGPLMPRVEPTWLGLVEDVSGREEWTGFDLAQRLGSER